MFLEAELGAFVGVSESISVAYTSIELRVALECVERVEDEGQ